MYQLQITDYFLLGLGIWLAALSFLLIKALSHYQKLTHGSHNIDLGKLLENIIKRDQDQAQTIDKVAKELDLFEKKSEGFLQKFALIRFNPFEDEGGDQSFAAAILDANDNGIVISSLHSRTGVRVYAKMVASGEAAKHQFTKEEKEAVEKARMGNK